MHEPLQFEPLLKTIRWGGTRLGSLLGKAIGNATDCAESWEIVDHGADQSRVVDGPYAGWTLHRLMEVHGDDLLGPGGNGAQFPLLVKYLDANDRLSVQVHPNDAQAKRHDPRENGKTEAWVIIAADPGSRVYAGLRAGIGIRQLRESVVAGRVAETLHSFEVGAGDCIFIPAGTVHAIGEGILLAEVQQSSDLTFRLDDWGRVGSDGRPRELHIEQALECIDFDRGPVGPISPSPRSDGSEELVRCDYFTMTRHRGPGSRALPAGKCRVLLGLAGESTLRHASGENRLGLGETLLIPAACGAVELEPAAGGIVLETVVP